MRCPRAGLLFLVLFLSGCSLFGKDNSSTNSAVPSTATSAKVDHDQTMAAGDPKYLNAPLPGPEENASSDATSIYYNPNCSDGQIADPFLLDDSAQAASTPTVAPVVPISHPETNESPEPAAQTPTTPATTADSLEAELAAAKERKEAAFSNYTRLATSGGEGDINEARQQYTEAVAEIKRLEAALQQR